MRIAEIAPLAECVPPRGYGGTERVVSYLTEALVDLGHDVTLFASGDSSTAARLVASWPHALRLDPGAVDRTAPQILQLEHIAQRAHEFDILHFHVDYLHLPLMRRLGVPYVTTTHGRLDLPELQPIYGEFSEAPLISISASQRRPLPLACWAGTVHHGLPADLYRYHPGPGAYLAFLGRLSPEKRVDRAIEIAKRTGLPLKIAAKIDPADRDYFEREVRHLLDHPLVEFVGEIGDAQKDDFLGNAIALVFPIDWPEPFGMVMVEALACGTPVVAFRGGAVEEVITHGETGYIVDDLDGAVTAVNALAAIDRRHCREVFEVRFSSRRMAEDYLTLYQATVDGWWETSPTPDGWRSLDGDDPLDTPPAGKVGRTRLAA